MSIRVSTLAFLGIFALLQSSAQVHFEGSGYKLAAEKAARLHKSLFIYFFTDWCAPCKQIPQIVFTDSRIRAVIDTQYVSLKLNAEKGEGIGLAKKYTVGGFPTFLFTAADGLELGRVMGTRSNDDYLLAIKSIGKIDPFRDRLKEEGSVHDSSTKK